MVGRHTKYSAGFPIIRHFINPNVRQIDLFYQSHNRLLIEKNQIITKIKQKQYDIKKKKKINTQKKK